MRRMAQRLLRPTYIAQTLTKEVNELLGLTYTRPILEYLDGKGDAGATLREIDVKAVGTSGTPKSASDTVGKLTKAGWVERRTNKRIVFRLTPRGRDALAYARQGDGLSTGNGAGGG